eukprot:1152494-Prymnesium_polylepis.1
MPSTTMLVGVALLCSLSSASSSRAVLFVKHTDGAVDRLLAELTLRADPVSAQYLEWLTREEVHQILKPRQDHLAAVVATARAHGAGSVTVLGDKVLADFPHSIPSAFSAAVSDFVDGASAFALSTPPRRPRAIRLDTSSNMTGRNDDPQACLSSLEGVTPTCVRQAYGLDGYATTAAGGQAFIVNQGFKPSDVALFQSTYSLPSQPVTHIVGKNDGKAGDEASLDAQYIMTTGSGVPTTYVYLDGSMENPFTNWLVWAAAAPDATLPKVHSLSLGAAEDQVGDAIIGRMNTEMAALGARGVSILFASGDSGWQPQQKFGAASPYVTAVGGIWNGEMRQSALQVDSLTTGGFAASSHNKAQPWQTAAIASFLKTKGMRPTRIDPAQRAVPDLSAYDDDISIELNGSPSSLSGTSAACPM